MTDNRPFPNIAPPTRNETDRPRRRAHADDAGKELLARTRRIETRLTQTMLHLGIPTQAQTPTFESRPNACGLVTIPSLHTPINAIMAVLPAKWDGWVDIIHNGELVATMDCRSPK